MRRASTGFWWVLCVLGLAIVCAPLCAQQPATEQPATQQPATQQPAAPQQQPAAQSPAATKPAADAIKIPSPLDVQLDTKDGVQLRATFYPSTAGKDAVPVILLHMWKGSRADLEGLALYLQQRKCAVLVPDLRGHGRSTRQQLADGGYVDVDKSRLGPDDYIAMVKQDMEACRGFLMRKNNNGELNISRLVVVGAEMGAAIAMKWSHDDWNWPALATSRQGQDVRALVLISPEANFKGIRATDALEDPDIRSTLSVAIVVGKNNSTAAGEADRMYRNFKRYHPDPPEGEQGLQDLFYAPFDTALQGTKIFEAKPQTMKGKPADLREFIGNFIDVRVARNRALPVWEDRRTPLDQGNR